MSPALTDFTILLNAFGAGIGLFLTYLLLSRKNGSPGQYFLASLLFLFVFFMINTIVQLSGYGELIHAYQDWANALCFLIGPILFGYVLSYTRSDNDWLSSYWIHFLPFLIFMPFLLGAGQLIFSENANQWLIYLWNFQVLIYLRLSYRALTKHKTSAVLPAFLARHFSLIWLLNFILFIVKMHWYPLPDIIFLNITLLFSFLIIMVALHTFGEEPKVHAQTQIFALPTSHYQRYSLQLQKLMEAERLYRNPNLSIQKLAQLAKIPPRYVSATLNHHLQQSFYEFVNSYRIKEVQETLQKTDSEIFTLNGIASQAGFNSISAFYKAFRLQTGMTPGAYKKQLECSAARGQE